MLEILLLIVNIDGSYHVFMASFRQEHFREVAYNLLIPDPSREVALDKFLVNDWALGRKCVGSNNCREFKLSTKSPDKILSGD